MRALMKDILLGLWLGFLVPGILLNGAVFLERQQEEPPAAGVTAKPEPGLWVWVSTAGEQPVRMGLDDYLTGVVLAEMPAGFHEEALKAQAVAARTYTWKNRMTGGKHKDGSVCTDPSCCQSYITEEAYLKRGGTGENLEKVQRCVQATSPMIILYGGDIIEATYFSASGGSTESALAVWGTDYPYLRSVSSPENQDASEESITFTTETFRDLLGTELPEDPAAWFGEVEYTLGGGVANMEIAGKMYSGTQLRALLGLRSTAFFPEIQADRIRITTSGYGHRVGMSQHGANAMAEAGSTYQKILQHYYPGTTLAPIWEDLG